MPIETQAKIFATSFPFLLLGVLGVVINFAVNLPTRGSRAAWLAFFVAQAALAPQFMPLFGIEGVPPADDLQGSVKLVKSVELYWAWHALCQDLPSSLCLIFGYKLLQPADKS